MTHFSNFKIKKNYSYDWKLDEIMNYSPIHFYDDNYSQILGKNEIIKLVKKYLKGNKITIEEILDGKIHYVYKVSDSINNFILKIRKKYFYSNKSISINPHDIYYEYFYLKLFEKNYKNIVPSVYEYNYDNCYILMEMLNDEYFPINNVYLKLEDFNAHHIGLVLGRLHKFLPKITIRTIEKEDIMYQNMLFYRFGFLKNDGVNNLIYNLARNRNGIIHGDLSPSNVFINKDGNIKLIDLETVHFGNIEFDIGFFLSHIVIIYFNEPNRLKKYLSEFIQGYKYYNKRINNTLIVKVIAACILYRFFSGFSYGNINPKAEYVDSLNVILSRDKISFNEFYKIIGLIKG